MEYKNKIKNPYIATEVEVNTQNPYISGMNFQAQPQTSPLFNGFDTKNFLIGAAIGVIGGYLLSNENAQKALFKTIAKGSELFQATIEEMKERYEDAKAEMQAQAEQ